MTRFNPDSADFSVRRQATARETVRIRPAANADDFFADDEVRSLPKVTKIESPPAPVPTPTQDADRERKLAAMKVASADLQKLGYSPHEVAQILAGNWKPEAFDTTSRSVPNVSVPVYEGFTLRSVAGKVLERLKGK